MDILDSEVRPYISLEQMKAYSARDIGTAKKYGQIVKAAEISNRDYGHRYRKFSASRAMRPPPSSHMHIFLGRLVVRNLGTSEQYETWMPSDVFDELYEAASAP
jgi:hypothetical protein